MSEQENRLVDKLADAANQLEASAQGLQETSEVAESTPQDAEVTPVTENTLPDEEVYALYRIEQEALKIQKGDLVSVQRELEQAQRKLIAVQGGIEGAQIMISRVLNEYGVTPETYIRQRDERFPPTQ